MALTSGQLEIIRRNQANQIVIEDLSVCHYCKSTGLKEEDQFCPNCGFPQRGSQMDMKFFLIDMKKKKELLKNKKKAVNKARNILYFLAGLYFVVGFFVGVVSKFDPTTIIVYLIVSGIYLTLALWSRKSPFPAILSGFFIFIILTVMTGIVDPKSLYQGAILKVIVISGFVYGYKGVKDSETLEKELQNANTGKNLKEENEVSEL